MEGDVQKFIDFWDSPLGQRVLEREAGYIQTRLKGCEKIIDIGCGIGVFEQKLASMNITGIDHDPAMIEEARKRNKAGKEFIHGNLYKLPFSSSSIDAVFSVATLEFLDDYKEAIREVSRVSKPGGKLIAMTLNPESSYFKERLKKENSYFRRFKHNPDDIKKYVKDFYNISHETRFMNIRNGRLYEDSKQDAAIHAFAAKKKLPLPPTTPSI